MSYASEKREIKKQIDAKLKEMKQLFESRGKEAAKADYYKDLLKFCNGLMSDEGKKQCDERYKLHHNRYAMLTSQIEEKRKEIDFLMSEYSKLVFLAGRSRR